MCRGPPRLHDAGGWRCVGQAKLSFTQRQHQLIRVLVTSLDQAARPSLSAKVGKSPRKAETYRFAGDSVLEWPATRKGMVELTSVSLTSRQTP